MMDDQDQVVPDEILTGRVMESRHGWLACNVEKDIGQASSSIISDMDPSFLSLSSDTIEFPSTFSTSTPELDSLSDTIQTSPFSNDMGSENLQSSVGESSEAFLTETCMSGDVSDTDVQQSSLNTSTKREFISDMSSLHPSIDSSICMCPCSMYKNTSYSPEELESRIQKIKKELTIDRRKTSSYQRSLFSAPDDRISARRLGYAGVVIMAVICVLIVLMDLPRCIFGLRNFINNCRD